MEKTFESVAAFLGFPDTRQLQAHTRRLTFGNFKKSQAYVAERTYIPAEGYRYENAREGRTSIVCSVSKEKMRKLFMAAAVRCGRNPTFFVGRRHDEIPDEWFLKKNVDASELKNCFEQGLPKKFLNDDGGVVIGIESGKGSKRTQVSLDSHKILSISTDAPERFLPLLDRRGIELHSSIVLPPETNHVHLNIEQYQEALDQIVEGLSMIGPVYTDDLRVD